MKIKRNSWLLKYAYGFVDSNIPDDTNVCELCWRVVGFSVLYPITGAILAVLSPAMLILWIVSKSGVNVHDEVRLPLPMRLAVQRIRDWKERVCTIIEIEP